MKLKSLIAAVAVAGIVSALTMQSANATQLTKSTVKAGTYSGVIRGDGAPYLISVTLTRGPGGRLSGVVAYSGSLECSGTWKYSGNEKSKLYFKETITQGVGPCAASSLPVVTPRPDEKILVTYYGDESIRGSLKRVS